MNKYAWTILSLIMVLTGCTKTTKDSIAFTTKSVTYHKVINKAEYTLDIDYPAKGNPFLVKNIREYINETLGGTYQGQLDDKDSLVNYYAHITLDSLRQLAKDYEQENYTLENLFISYKIKKLTESKHYITYQKDYSEYMGGAHGYGTITGITFRKEDGRRFGYEIFKNINTEEFHQLIKEGLKSYFKQANNNLPLSDADLRGYLLTDDDINYLSAPVSPPYFTDKGIIFIYSPYEIAPYAAGQPCFTIPYDKIKPLLTTTAQQLIK